MKKVLLVVLDGVGDYPNKELGFKTPLGSAHKPLMDSLAKRGRLGLIQLVRENFATETDSGALSLLGYDVMKYYSGRGPLEAYGCGLKMSDGDIAFRVNFATGVDGRIIDRRVCRDLSDKEAENLVSDINKNIKLTSVPSDFQMKSLGGAYRCSLVIKKKNGSLSGNISNTDPAYQKSGSFSSPLKSYEMIVQECKPLDSTKAALEAATLANEFSSKVSEFLAQHLINKKRSKENKCPVNLILMRDCGDHLPLLSSLERKFKAKFGVAAEMFVEHGIALLAEAKIIDIAGYYKIDYTSDYKHYAEAILKAMGDLDVVYIHIKGPDDAGHDGNPLKKKMSIELIDKLFFGNLLPHINLNETVIAITSDHSTPCDIKTHSADPVPLLLVGGGITPEKAKEFSESSCSKGSLKLMYGIELMPLLIKIADGHELPETYFK